MVTVLVPTGTPFSADRRLEAERHHFGHENNGGRGNVTAAESPSWPILPSRRSCSARAGGCGGSRSDSPPRSPTRSVSGLTHRTDQAVRELQALPRVGTDAIRTDEHAGPTTEVSRADPATHYAGQQTEARVRLPTAHATTCHVSEPDPISS